jgi:hypothetical protein
MVCGGLKSDGTPCQRKGKCPWHIECPICLAVDSKTKTKLECGHSFHEECINGWRSTGHTTCPVCRREFVKPQFRVVLTVTRNDDGATGTTRALVDDTITEVLHRMFRLDIETLNIPSIFTDVHFDVETIDTLERIIGELGLEMPELTP